MKSSDGRIPRTYLGVLIAVVLLIGVAGLPAAATDSNPHLTPKSDAVTEPVRDESEMDLKAMDYAAATGLDLPTAKRNVSLMEQARQTMFTLRAYAGDKLAGIYWEHQPALRIRLRLAGEPDEALSKAIAQSPVPVIVQADALFSREEAKERFDLALPLLRERVPELQGAYVDERTGEAVLGVYRAEEAERDAEWQARVDQAIASFVKEAGLPVRVEFHTSRETVH
jgi:hypothetical protein